MSACQHDMRDHIQVQSSLWSLAHWSPPGHLLCTGLDADKAVLKMAWLKQGKSLSVWIPLCVEKSTADIETPICTLSEWEINIYYTWSVVQFWVLLPQFVIFNTPPSSLLKKSLINIYCLGNVKEIFKNLPNLYKILQT